MGEAVILNILVFITLFLTVMLVMFYNEHRKVMKARREALASIIMLRDYIDDYGVTSKSWLSLALSEVISKQ